MCDAAKGNPEFTQFWMSFFYSSRPTFRVSSGSSLAQIGSLTHQMSKESDILELYLMPGQPKGVYSIGLGAKRVTFYSQQVRAFNLAYFLEFLRLIQPGDHVAVVGASIAGMTIAACLSVLGCKVTVFEAKDSAFPLFADNDQRHIIPRLAEWPSEVSRMMCTNFPFLNWKGGSAKSVVDQLKSEIWPFENLELPRYGMRVVELKQVEEREILLNAEKSRVGAGAASSSDIFNSVIFATGFGPEAPIPGIVSSRYWSVNNLHQDEGAGPKIPNILVSGTGDGAIMDLLRLAVRDFDLRRFCDPEKSIMMAPDFMSNVAEIERMAPINPDKAAAYFQREYLKIGFPAVIENLFQRRGQVHATLNIGNGNLLNINALPFNRLLMHWLNVKGMMEVRAFGRLSKAATSKNGETRAYFKKGNVTYSLKFDNVIPRHGPVMSGNQLVTADSLLQHSKKFPLAGDPTVIPAWPDDFYKRGTRTLLSPHHEDLRRAALFGIVEADALINETSRSRAAANKLNQDLV